MSCQFCGGHFSRGYNMRRHEQEYCSLQEQGGNMYRKDSDSQDRDFQDDVSTTSTQQSRSSSTTDTESEEESDR